MSSPKPDQTTAAITTESFINHPEVLDCLKQLENEFEQW